MGEKTAISWTDATFNPFLGCTKISVGCQNCYAEQLMDKRYGRVHWGPKGTRQRTSAANWKKPLQWNKDKWMECGDCYWRGSMKAVVVAASGCFACPQCAGENMTATRQRVFCASLADVFEENEQLVEWRADLLALITNTPNLDWLLLTKRPENVMRQVEQAGEMLLKKAHNKEAVQWSTWIKHGINYAPSNVWFGTSVENQEAADKRIPELLKIPAKVRFLSCEPLLGSVDLGLLGVIPKDIAANYTMVYERISWVIAGGESGHNARPMHPDWIRSLRNQCQQANVAFHFKQYGEYVGGYGSRTGYVSLSNGAYLCGDKNTHEWSAGIVSQRVGKHAAGRLLDGVEWNEFPVTETDMVMA